MIEQTILNNLIQNEDYVRKVIPYLKAEYFHDYSERFIFKEIVGYFEKYNKPPSIEAIRIASQDSEGLSETNYDSVSSLLLGFGGDNNSDASLDWLLDQTEKFCQDKAIYNAIMESISVIDGKSDKGRGALPTILSDALSVSFDPHIGHDFLDDAEHRWEFYHQKEVKVGFDIDLLNDCLLYTSDAADE